MSTTKRFSLLLVLVDYRAPVANPPVEPDRPDLFEEPTIAPECQPTASDTC
jgi:hypothetical protein